MPIENWMLFHDRTLHAPRWPWGAKAWESLAAQDVAALPHSVADFTRVAPSDGFDTLVPSHLPREEPVCRTTLAVYHDNARVYVFMHGVRPATPLRELADLLDRNDFTCVFQLDGIERGRYFGLNEKGEAIGTLRAFDPPLLRAADVSGPGWATYHARPWADVGGYKARVIAVNDGLVATWAIDKAVLAPGIFNNRIRFAANRRCYATNEPTAWASMILWQPRTAELGDVVFVDDITTAELPGVRRIDIAYDAAAETGTIRVHWRDLWNTERFAALTDKTYADFLDKCAITLNGEERVVELAPNVEATFDIADGWNRLEIQSGYRAPLGVTFMKLSGNRVVTPPARRIPVKSPSTTPHETRFPARDELIADFARWHKSADKTYRGDGIWGHPLTHESGGGQKHNISHNGAFMATPYALACLHLERTPVYEARVRALCERAIAMQKPEGWFPELAIDPSGVTPFAGGGFDTGAAGEALALGYRVLGDERYLDAARKVVDSYRLYRQEVNMNYAAFAAWHLTELLAIEKSDRALDLAIYYVRHNATLAIDISGSQDAHNYYSTYGGITLKAMAKLYALLPPDHEYRATLRDRTLRMCNQMLWRQQPDGRFAERNRKYVGFWSLAPVVGLIETSLALGPEVAAELRPAITHAYAAQKSSPDGAIVARMTRL